MIDDDGALGGDLGGSFPLTLHRHACNVSGVAKNKTDTALIVVVMLQVALFIAIMFICWKAFM